LIQTSLKDQRDTDKARLLKAIGSKGKKITVIVGLSKNAGKTTFLNWLLEQTTFSQKGVITTGRDGEDLDVLEKVKKPKVKIPQAAIFTARASEVSKKSGFLHVLEKLPFKAGGQDIWLVKSDTSLETEIVGPPSVSEQIETARKILSYGVEHIFIDGSLDRKAISSAWDVDSLIVTGSPMYGNLARLKRGFKRLHDLTKIKGFHEVFPENLRMQLLQDEHIKVGTFKNKTRAEIELTTLAFKTLLGHEKEIAGIIRVKGKELSFLYIPTSITEKSFLLLKSLIQELDNLQIVVKHPFHLQLEDQSSSWLRHKNVLLTLKKMDIAGMVINSYAVNGNHLDCEHFRSAIRTDFALPVIDVMEIG